MSNRPLIQACVLLMGELSPLDRDAVTATFAQHEPVPGRDYLPAHNAAVEEFLPLSAGLTERLVEHRQQGSPAYDGNDGYEFRCVCGWFSGYLRDDITARWLREHIRDAS